MAELVVDEIRGAQAEAQFAALEDAAFGVKAPGHYLDDFPIWDFRYAPGAGSVMKLGVFDGTKLVAAAGVRLGTAQFPSSPLCVALMGAVATAPAYRGRGLASQLVSVLVQWAAQRGAALAVLWGSEHQLYQKLGFLPCGSQVSIPLHSLVALDQGIQKVSTGWSPGILKALKSRRSGLEIRDLDRGWLAAHKNVQWFWTGEANQVTAYAAMGRGIDLSQMVHEWGGEPHALLSILKKIGELDPTAMILGAPAIFSRYGFQFDSSKEENLGLIRVIDAEAVCRAAHRDLRVTAIFDQAQWDLTLQGSSGDIFNAKLTPLEISHLFFGQTSAIENRFASEYFPLPIWFWGLDAV